MTLVAGDAKAAAPAHADAVICIGASQVWNPPGSNDQPMGYHRALTALRDMVERGAWVIYGEAVWSVPPTPAAAALLSGRLDELQSVGALVEIAVESGYSACYARWLSQNSPGHADTAEVQAMARRQREAYWHGYRGVMGMAYLQLVAT